MQNESPQSLTLLPSFFSINSQINNWLVEFNVAGYDSSNQLVKGTAFLNLVVNQLPTNGSCILIGSANGSACSTIYRIVCSNWHDPDGQIMRYEFFATFANNPNPIQMNYNRIGSVNLTLPAGPSFDSNRVNVFVRVVDDSDGFTVFNISRVVQIYPDTIAMNEIMGDILGNNLSSYMMLLKSSASMQLFSKNFICFLFMLNDDSDYNKINSNQVDLFKSDSVI